MMKPVLDKYISFGLSRLCREVGLKDLQALPKANNIFFIGCWAEVGEKMMMHHAAKSGHKIKKTAAQTPDDFTAQLIQMLQPGIDKLLDFFLGGGGAKEVS